MSGKTCTKCGVEKPLEEFSKDARHTDGRYSKCKTCSNARNRANTAWGGSGYRSKLIKNFLQRARTSNEELTRMQAEAIADAAIAARQVPNLHCYICGARQPGGSGRGKSGWQTDHDHRTHLFRGLLCQRCNVRVEWFERHRNAVAEYLLNGGGDQSGKDQPR